MYMQRLQSYMSYAKHYSDVKMGTMASQITSLTIVYWIAYSGADQRKHQKLRVTSLCDRWPVNSPHKWPVTRKMFPFDDIIALRNREGFRGTAFHSTIVVMGSML